MSASSDPSELLRTEVHTNEEEDAHLKSDVTGYVDDSKTADAAAASASASAAHHANANANAAAVSSDQSDLKKEFDGDFLKSVNWEHIVVQDGVLQTIAGSPIEVFK